MRDSNEKPIVIEFDEPTDYDMLTREERVAQDIETLAECLIDMRLHIKRMAQ